MKFIKNTLILASLFLVPSVIFSQKIDPVSHFLTKSFKNKKYDFVKHHLVSDGYIPVVFKRKYPVGPCPGVGSCDSVPEVIDCSGEGFCDFAFHGLKNSGYVIVSTSGEYATVDVVHTAGKRIEQTWKLSGLEVQ